MNDKILYPRYLFRKKIALNLLKKYLPKLNNFLEIGPGKGDFTESLIKNIKQGDVIEFSNEAVIELKNKFRNKNINIIEDDFLKYNFKNKYSLIVMFEVLEHIKDDKITLNKLYNLLEDNGILIFSVPSRMKKWGVWDDIAGHYRRYEKNDLIKLLENTNFKIIKFISYGFPFINITSFGRELMLKSNHKKLTETTDKKTLSKNSGLGFINYFKNQKILKLIIKYLFCNKLINLYIKISQPFNNYNLGDGYLCITKK